ncbi:flagellar hook-basal body complex protein [Sandarakinorhabdus oryzae]|uniref:flagellar hook-basal body complex protein n=1 Tax=Sandarakinorhabdus oryzae TaxID=2675220 RepID=UPI0012E12D83|nr:flagellar hook-basal body complex protein [Sandarakinorhabdus oryzae]
MDRLIYTALTGLSARAREQLVTANNLANAQVPGFRREMVAQEGRYLDARRAADGAWEARAQVGAPSLATPAVPGKVQATARSLDVALSGNAWLAVQGPVIGGEVRQGYTRRGDLSLSSTGILTNGDGRVVLGINDAPISVPPGAALNIATDGRITALLPDGPTEVGQLKLVDGRSLSPRDKAADGLFLPEARLPRDPAARVESGALESANVTATEALVELVEEQRGFEVNARLIRHAQEMDEQGARLMRLDG